MPDRVIRDEILNSDRWATLPTDTHRVVFIGLILIADDYGNIEGGPRRLYRWMHSFTQIKSEADSIKLMSDLQDAEMVLRYEDLSTGGKEYWHLTRFRNTRRYWSRKYPQSPYTENDTTPTKQSGSRTIDAGLAQTSAHLHRGVGVGVGEERGGVALKARSETCIAIVANGKVCGKPGAHWRAGKAHCREHGPL